MSALHHALPCISVQQHGQPVRLVVSWVPWPAGRAVSQQLQPAASCGALRQAAALTSCHRAGPAWLQQADASALVLQELSQLHHNISSLEAWVTQVAASLSRPHGQACTSIHDLVRRLEQP